MARWNHDERTIEAKLVYYGPALGGKTTTLEALRALSGEAVSGDLISIRTADERTLLFDLLPLDAGEILGYRVALKAYATSGQVPYDAARRAVLAAADAVVFVADSRSARREQNVWSLQNLRLNMRSASLDSARLPVVYQFNKQDLPDAASPEQVAGWLGIDPARGFGSAALAAQGVLEPFVAGCRALLARIFDDPPAPLSGKIDRGALARDIDAALAACLARARGRRREGGHRRIVPAGEDLLACALQASMELAERLSAPAAVDRGTAADATRRTAR